MSSRARDVTSRVLSVEEYEQLQEPEEYRSELVRGLLVREPRPGAYHAWIQTRLTHRLDAYVEKESLGSVFTDVGVVIAKQPPTVRGPDIAFYARDRLPAPLPHGFLERAPDLAVEIVSPSNTVSELLAKVTEYLQAGTRLVWVVDPLSRTATVYRSRDEIRLLTEYEVLDGEDVVPGFSIVVNDILP
jgi:Uma2 family endonuclease